MRMSGKDALSHLEPGVIFPGAEKMDLVTVEDSHIQLSIAISLKRVADALTTVNVGDLHGTITNMAWEAGRSFAAGQRTDR